MFRIKVYDSFDSDKQRKWISSAESEISLACDEILSSPTHAVRVYIIHSSAAQM